MARLMTHFALGATLTALILHIFFADLQYKRSVIFFGGIWALIPEFYLYSPVFEHNLYQLSHSCLANLFWFHRSLNQHFTENEFRRVGMLMIGVLLFVILGTEWNESTRRDRGD